MVNEISHDAVSIPDYCNLTYTKAFLEECRSIRTINKNEDADNAANCLDIYGYLEIRNDCLNIHLLGLSNNEKNIAYPVARLCSTEGEHNESCSKCNSNVLKIICTRNEFKCRFSDTLKNLRVCNWIIEMKTREDVYSTYYHINCHEIALASNSSNNEEQSDTSGSESDLNKGHESSDSTNEYNKRNALHNKVHAFHDRAMQIYLKCLDAWIVCNCWRLFNNIKKQPNGILHWHHRHIKKQFFLLKILNIIINQYRTTEETISGAVKNLKVTRLFNKISKLLDTVHLNPTNLFEQSLTIEYMRIKFELNRSYDNTITNIKDDQMFTRRILQRFVTYWIVEMTGALLFCLLIERKNIVILINLVVPADSLNYGLRLLSACLINSPLGIKFHKVTQDFIWLNLVNNLSDMMYVIWASIVVLPTQILMLRVIMVVLGIYGGTPAIIYFLLDVFRIATVHIFLIYKLSYCWLIGMKNVALYFWEISTHSTPLDEISSWAALFDRVNPFHSNESQTKVEITESPQAHKRRMIKYAFEIKSNVTTLVCIIGAIGLAILAYGTPSTLCFFAVTWFINLCRSFTVVFVGRFLTPLFNTLCDRIIRRDSPIEQWVHQHLARKIEGLNERDGRILCDPTRTLNSRICHSMKLVLDSGIPWIDKKNDSNGSNKNYNVDDEHNRRRALVNNNVAIRLYSYPNDGLEVPVGDNDCIAWSVPMQLSFKDFN